MTYIYLVEKCYGDKNKVYIGKSITPKSRREKHRKKYGRDILFNIIEEVPSLISKDWKPLEAFYIQYFKFLGFEVLNKNNGGGGHIGGIPSWNKGMKLGPNEKITLAKLNHPDCSKPILQYDLEGNFVREYPSIMEARRNNPKGDIDGCVQGRYKKAGGYQWFYKEDIVTEKITPYVHPRGSKYKTLEEKKQARRLRDRLRYGSKKLKNTTNT